MGTILAAIKNVRPTKQLTDLLIKHGYDAAFVKNQKQIDDIIEREEFDLMIVDFTMPSDEGFHLAEKMRKTNELSNLPMIGFIDEFTNIESAFASGVTDVIDKNYYDDSLIAKIRIYKEVAISKALTDKSVRALARANDDFEALSRRVELVAIQDAMTNLYTRKFAMEQLEIAISRFDRAGVSFSVIIGDIDDFRVINENYGPSMGDEILMDIGQTLKYYSRVQDVVARWGGEEFLMLLPDTNLEGAIIYAERARMRIEEKVFKKGAQEISATMTFGVVSYNHVMPFNMLLTLVDDALFLGKNNGKNRVITSEI